MLFTEVSHWLACPGGVILSRPWQVAVFLGIACDKAHPLARPCLKWNSFSEWSLFHSFILGMLQQAFLLGYQSAPKSGHRDLLVVNAQPYLSSYFNQLCFIYVLPVGFLTFLSFCIFYFLLSPCLAGNSLTSGPRYVPLFLPLSFFLLLSSV